MKDLSPAPFTEQGKNSSESGHVTHYKVDFQQWHLPHSPPKD
jgi:hypothetical protein